MESCVVPSRKVTETISQRAWTPLGATGDMTQHYGMYRITLYVESKPTTDVAHILTRPDPVGQ